ncbi:MAG: hypothetical protein ACI9FN_001788 [Saprospiraceae bacterium]|jgi:uncharacterized protein YehS (DUF1456 family)
MNNNDILRRLRYVFDWNDDQVINLFLQADHTVSRAQISDWLKSDDDPDVTILKDRELAIFLNGFINKRRGKREGQQILPEEILTNNMILRKLKIALNLKDIDMIEIFHLAKVKISKHELSAFFRRADQVQYRECMDQYLRNFIKGMQAKYRK